jgi:hypothetical protein
MVSGLNKETIIFGLTPVEVILGTGSVTWFLVIGLLKYDSIRLRRSNERELTSDGAVENVFLY